MTLQVTPIPLERIEIDPENVRTAYPRETVDQLRQALCASIGAGEQFINPPTVYPVGENRFRVKHGNCRVLAAQGVVDELYVRIVEPPANQVDKLLDQLGENLLQGGLDPVDTAHALRHLRDSENLSLSGVVELLAQRGIKRSKFWVNMHLGLLRLHPFVVDAIRGGQIAPRTAWLLRGLSEADQIRWTRDIMAQGLTQRAVEERLGPGAQAEEADDNERDGEIDTSRPEVAYLQIGQRIEEAAKREEELPRRPRRQLDADHRSGNVERRWELIPARLPHAARTDNRLRMLEQHDWIKRASVVQRDLAREFVYFGGCNVEAAISLAERASQEAAEAPEQLVAAANQLAQLAEQAPRVEPDSALVQLLSLRVTRVTQGQPGAEEVAIGS